MPARENRPRFKARRAGRIARRREEILHAAARVFADKGYTGTTIAEIAAAADLAEGTLYNYFPSKRDLLLAVAGETEAPMESIILEAGQIMARGDLVGVIEHALDLPEARLAFLRAMLSEAWHDDGIMQEFVARRLVRIHHRLTAYVADGVAAGRIRAVDPALTAQLIIGMFSALILPVIRGASEPPGPAERHALAEAIADLLLNGLLAAGA